MDLPPFLQLQPCVLPLGQLAQTLVDKQVSGNQLGFGVVESGKYRFIYLGLTGFGVVSGFPPILLNQSLRDLLSTTRIERYFFCLCFQLDDGWGEDFLELLFDAALLIEQRGV